MMPPWAGSTPRTVERAVLSGIVFTNNKMKRLAIRLTRWTGKSREYVHPKHLLGDTEEQYWYLSHIPAAARVLDVGCGNGMHTIKVAHRAASVVGLDYSLESLGVGRRSAASAGAKNVWFAATDLERGLAVASAGFDIVLCLDLLEHVYARDLVLTEIRRVLRPGGVLLLGVPNRATSWKRRLERAGLFAYSDPDHKIEYTLPELERELATNGFVIRRLQPSVYDTPWIGAIDVVGGLSLATYRRISALRRRYAARYPEENAGFYAVCEAKPQ